MIPVVPPTVPPNAYGSTISALAARSRPTITVIKATSTSAESGSTSNGHAERKWYFNVDFLWMSTKPPQGIFGNPNAQTYVRQERDFINSTLGSSRSSRARQRHGSGSSSEQHSTPANSCCRTRASSPIRRLISRHWPTTTTRLTWRPGRTVITEGAPLHMGWWNPDNSGLAPRFWFGGTGDATTSTRPTTTRSIPKTRPGWSRSSIPAEQ